MMNIHNTGKTDSSLEASIRKKWENSSSGLQMTAEKRQLSGVGYWHAFPGGSGISGRKKRQ